MLYEKPSEQLSPKSLDDLEITWTIKETKSPIDDRPEVSGTLVAVGSDARLVLRCKEKETNVTFYKPFAFLGIGESVKVLVRIDDGQPIETMWLPSANRQAAYAPSAIQFIRALPDKGKLFVRAMGGTRKSASKISTVTRPKPFLSAELCSSRSSGILKTKSAGFLKNLGLVIGRAKMNVFAARAAELAEARPELAAAVEPLLKAREAVERQIADLDRKVMRLARNRGLCHHVASGRAWQSRASQRRATGFG